MHQVVGTRPPDVVRWDRPSGLFFGVFFKTIYTSPLMKTGYLCTLMTINLFSVVKTTNEAECFLTEEGSNIYQWYNNNLLQGKFSKHQVMCLGPRNYHKDLHIVINDTVIDQKS